MTSSVSDEVISLAEIDLPASFLYVSLTCFISALMTAPDSVAHALFVRIISFSVPKLMITAYETINLSPCMVNFTE